MEVTFEVNTDDVTEMKLKDWKQVGINRLSIGLQSFDDEELKWFNRIHSSSQGINSVKMAQDKGFRNISIHHEGPSAVQPQPKFGISRAKNAKTAKKRNRFPNLASLA